MADILGVYMTYINHLLSIKIPLGPDFGISVGSLWLAAVVMVLGRAILGWIFGINVGVLSEVAKDKVTLRPIRNLRSMEKASGGVASRKSNSFFRRRFSRPSRRDFSHRSGGMDI